MSSKLNSLFSFPPLIDVDTIPSSAVLDAAIVADAVAVADSSSVCIVEVTVDASHFVGDRDTPGIIHFGTLSTFLSQLSTSL